MFLNDNPSSCSSLLRLTNLSEFACRSSIRTSKSSVNYRDLMVSERSPAYPLAAKSNLVPCSDGSGIVEAIGPSSTWEKGDRVVLCGNTWEDGDNRNFDFSKTLGGGEFDGTLRRWMVVDDSRLVRAPKNLSLIEASTLLFTAGNTACRALFFGPIVADSNTTVLTQGTGGVSCYAIQVGRPSRFQVPRLILFIQSSQQQSAQLSFRPRRPTRSFSRLVFWAQTIQSIIPRRLAGRKKSFV